jgi:hypothetical protein
MSSLEPLEHLEPFRMRTSQARARAEVHKQQRFQPFQPFHDRATP